MESGVILIVDDEISIRRALHTTLQKLGFKVVEAARGEAVRLGVANHGAAHDLCSRCAGQ